MSKFLDRLAMEVDVWTAAGFHKAGMRNDDYSVLASESWEGDWLRRRAELINEPDDKDAPEWAKWKAQDSDGTWYWHLFGPILDNWIWLQVDGKTAVGAQGKIPAGHDWRKTLRKVERKVCDGADASELPHCFGVDFGAEANGLDSIKTLCVLIDITDDCIAKLMLQTTLAQVLEREYGVDLSND